MTREGPAKPPEMVERILNAVRQYDVFNEDNDPRGEHDFGRMKITGVTAGRSTITTAAV